MYNALLVIVVLTWSVVCCSMLYVYIVYLLLYDVNTLLYI